MSNNIDVLLLAAGVGSRLKHLTEVWLVPDASPWATAIGMWLYDLQKVGAGQIFVNLHHHANHVKSFLDREHYQTMSSKVLNLSSLVRQHNTQY